MTSQLPTNTALKFSILQQYWVFIGSDRNTTDFLLKTGMAHLRLQIYGFLTALNRESSDIKIVFFLPLHYILVCNICYCFFHSSATRFVWKPKTKWSSTGKWSEVPGNKIWNQLLRTYLILYITRLSVFYLQ